MSNQEAKYSFINKALNQRKKNDRLRRLTNIEPSLEGPEIEIDGKRLINFCSNDYLGLAAHQEVIKRSKEFLEKYGAGSSSSRLISGTQSIHVDLEDKLAKTFGFESALIFNSGFQANVAIISAILDRNSLIVIDKKCHNSLVQGAILSRATIKRFHHNDSAHVESILQDAQDSSYNRVLIVTETIFSMDGDRNKLNELVDLAKRYNAILYSDDAHALGVLGDKGLGLNYGTNGVDLSIGTFGKSFGGFGAFVGCSKEMKDYLLNFASGFIYTTALPPSVIGGLDAALDLIPNLYEQRSHLFKLVEYFKPEIRKYFEIADTDSQIIPIIIGDETETLKISKYMQDNGLWISAIRPPTVEEGASRLRVTITARHTKEHVDQLIKSLKNWKHD